MDEKSEQQELAELLLELNNNPATRDATLRLIKKVRPNAPIPEIDNADAVTALRAEFDEKFQLQETRFREKDLTRALNEKRTAVKEKFNLGDDDITEVEKLMTDGKIVDYDAAAEHLSLQRRMSVPTPARRERVKPFEGIDIAAFQADPEGAALDLMYKDMDDITQGRVRIN